MKVRVAVCVPPQRYDRDSKLEWLANAVAKTECDLFLTPQEYFGGVKIMPQDKHIEREWIQEKVGGLAKLERKVIGVGAAISGGKDFDIGTEAYLYYDADGDELGCHEKYALPSYDDVRKGGSGQLASVEPNFDRFVPIYIASLGLRVGTVFCWEVFSPLVFGKYAVENVNLIVHPIKFAPRAWCWTNTGADGRRHLAGFAQDESGSSLWAEKLVYASRHEVLCPIAVSCNSWALGAEYNALFGFTDGVLNRQHLHEVPAEGEADHTLVFELETDVYDLFSAPENAIGDVELKGDLARWTMYRKLRRIEQRIKP